MLRLVEKLRGFTEIFTKLSTDFVNNFFVLENGLEKIASLMVLMIFFLKDEFFSLENNSRQ